MKRTNQIIIDAIIKKAERECPQSLAMIGIYGSVATGDVYEKSDLDLMLLINDDEGWKLSAGFILDDSQIGYDIYCTNWSMIENDAQCNHAHLSKLMDSEIVYVKDQNAVRRLEEIREKTADFLKSSRRFEKVQEVMKNAKERYADALISNSLSDIRKYAAYTIQYLLDAVMLWNGNYFHRGVKRTFDELDNVVNPKDFQNDIRVIVASTDMSEMKQALTRLMSSTVQLIEQKETTMNCVKEEASKDNISGSYEEMFSNWRNKMIEAAEQKNIYASFMNLVSLQTMLDEIGEQVAIGEYAIMERYNPNNLSENVAIFDETLNNYLSVYHKAGIEPKHYANVEEFVKAYSQLNT